jgi:hypothetical protein
LVGEVDIIIFGKGEKYLTSFQNKKTKLRKKAFAGQNWGLRTVLSLLREVYQNRGES